MKLLKFAFVRNYESNIFRNIFQTLHGDSLRWAVHFHAVSDVLEWQKCKLYFLSNFLFDQVQKLCNCYKVFL